MRLFSNLASERAFAFRKAESGANVQSFTEQMRVELRRLLHDAVSNYEFLQCTASKSYRHVAGFDKLVLWEGERFEKLTLHIWWGSREAPNINVPHTHRFSFLSTILIGSLDFVTFDKRVGLEDTSVELQYQPLSGRAVFEPSDRTVNLLPTQQARVKAGDTYFLSFHVPHLITGADYPTASLVFRGARERQTAFVYPATRGDLPEVLPLKAMTSPEVAAKLTEIASRI